MKSIEFGLHYIGQTSDLEKRLLEHNSGKENFTSRYLPWEIVLYIENPSRKEALILEKKLKNLNGEDLKEFIRKYK